MTFNEPYSVASGVFECVLDGGFLDICWLFTVAAVTPDCVRVELVIGVSDVSFVSEIRRTPGGAVVVSVPPRSFFCCQLWRLGVFFPVGVPRMPIRDWELAVPLPVRRLVYPVDMDMTTLTQRDGVRDSIICIVAVEMV
ncbi:hypothetical protein PM085_02115 [Halorubrum ezzemoulense]|uniref:Uncharacterized protein n=1 Tax=Halorubrum ezzemoulense TaxID=337243 RepID=A0ABT4YZC1_HALEZ|nr:hypothetical protein [Halorubrum ezzemoulense]